MDFKSLKRSELQKLAKKNGIKANKKNSEIIAELERLHAITKDDSTSCNESIGRPEDVSIEIPSGAAGLDIMSVKAPWENKDLTFDSLDSGINSTPDSSSPGLSRTSRGRSSSRTKTPDVANTNTRIVDGKTFSVERKPTRARTVLPSLKSTKRTSSQTPEDNKSKKKRKIDDFDEELATEIMAGIREKIAAESEKNMSKSSRIPRFTTAGASISSKCATPGSKRYEAQEKRFHQTGESIVDSQKNKERRAKKLAPNSKHAASVSRLSRPRMRNSPKIIKPVMQRGKTVPISTPSSRVPSKTPSSILKVKNDNRADFKPSSKPVFKPTVTSTRNMDLNFGSKSSKLATPKRVTIVSDQNKAKQSYVKTPGTGMRTKSALRTLEKKRRSAAATPKPSGGGLRERNAIERRISMPTTPRISSLNDKRKSIPVTPKTPSQNPTTPGGTKKPVFDLKESLKKPLTWVPHKGPLLPYVDSAKKTKPSFRERLQTIKEPKVTGRVKRNQKLAEKKKMAKDRRMMQRRGIA